MLPTLTIAIPTYNRADKLARLVRMLRQQLEDPAVAPRVRILISDNASTDHTPAIVQSLANLPGIRSHRQPRNLGFDRNLKTLYELADTDYVWYFGDDDLPLPKAVSDVLDAIDRAAPDVVLSSFIQPLGSAERQFAFAESLHVEHDPREIARLIVKYPKLTIYVLRRVRLTPEHSAKVEASVESGWIFLRLAFAVLELAEAPIVAIRSEPIASCDEEIHMLDWAPTAMLKTAVPVRNSFVVRHDPGLIRRQEEQGYLSAIQFCFAVKTMSIIPSDMMAYDRFIRELPIRARLLAKHPRSLLQLMLIRSGLAHLWPGRGGRARRAVRAT